LACAFRFFWRVCAANGALLVEQDKQIRKQKELTMSRLLDLFPCSGRDGAAPSDVYQGEIVATVPSGG
jgi:hypothetical protein